MHDPRRTSDTSDPAAGTDASEHTSIPIPAAGPSGDLTVFERLEAFRDLIRHGHSLLGEVMVYCRQAEAAVNQLASDKQVLDRTRAELEAEKARAVEEAEAARALAAQLEEQRTELASMRAELARARADVEDVQQHQRLSAGELEKSAREAREQQARLAEELARVRSQSAASQLIETKLAAVDGIETKLRSTERELAETRRALEAERSRRDRAIALIKPKTIVEGARA